MFNFQKPKQEKKNDTVSVFNFLFILQNTRLQCINVDENIFHNIDIISIFQARDVFQNDDEIA